MSEQEPNLETTELVRRKNPIGATTYEFSIPIEDLPKSYFRWIEYFVDHDLIRNFDDIDTTNVYDYIPPQSVVWAWEYLVKREADPMIVARIRLEGIRELQPLDLIGYCHRSDVDTIDKMLSILRLDQKGRVMNNLSTKFRREITIFVIFKDLLDKGSFMVDKEKPSDLRAQALIYFNASEKRLVKGTALLNFICKWYNVEQGTERKAIAERLETVAHTEAEPIEVYNLYQWNGAENELYFTNADGSYYILKGNGEIEEKSNGETIIFNDPGDFEPYKYIGTSAAATALEGYSQYGFFNKPPSFPPEFLEVQSIMFKLTALRCNFAEESALTLEEQQILYYIVLHAMPFVTLLESVPIVSAHGAPGAGKTFSMTQLAKFIFGRGYRPEVFPDGIEDFWTIIGNSRLYVFDNVEYLPKWVPDAIAAVATGTRKTKRARYTDWDITKIDPRLFIFLTSVRAPYRQPAVVERLIPFVFEKFDRTVSKEGSLSELFNPFDKYRNALMSQFINNTDKIVGGIKKRGGLIGQTSHRMADFSILAQIINEELQLCSESFFKDMMENLVKQRARFAFFDNSWFRALSVIFAREPGKLYTMKELAEDASIILEDDGDTVTATQLGKYIAKYQDDMKTIFKLERKNHSGKSMICGYNEGGDYGQYTPPSTVVEGFELEAEDTRDPGTKLGTILEEFRKFFVSKNSELVRDDETHRFISARTGVSQDSVKEALNILRTEGTITVPKTGYYSLPTY